MPGGIRCSVGPCKSHQGKTKGVSFFTFPRNQQVRKEWIQKCYRSDKINPNNARICSLHFLPSDYERNLKAELLHLPSRKKLKRNAVPSLLLKSTFTEETALERQSRLDVKETDSIRCEEFSSSTFKTQESLQETISNAQLHKEIEFIDCEEVLSTTCGPEEPVTERNRFSGRRRI